MISFENHTLNVLPQNYKTKSPCYNCYDRTDRCHTFCEKYKKYKLELEKEKREIKLKIEEQNQKVNSMNKFSY